MCQKKREREFLQCDYNNPIEKTSLVNSNQRDSVTRLRRWLTGVKSRRPKADYRGANSRQVREG